MLKYLQYKHGVSVIRVLGPLLANGLLCAFMTTIVQTKMCNADTSSSVELRDLAKAAQADAFDEKLFSAPNGYETVRNRAQKRLDRVRALLRKNKITTKEDFDNASYLFDYPENIDDILTEYDLSLIAILNGGAGNQVAHTEDLLLREVGRHDRFGSTIIAVTTRVKSYRNLLDRLVSVQP